MVEHGNLPESEFEKLLRMCHWGVSVMDINDDHPLYNRYSLPSKTVRYLAAGLPIISVGHHDSTIIHFGRRYRVGMVLDDNSIPDSDQYLQAELAETNPYRRYKQEILRAARERFDAANMRNTLFQQFMALADA